MNIDFFTLTYRLQKEAKSSGVIFTPDGFPILTDFAYPTDIPEDCEVLPYSRRNMAKDPQKTILVFFECDSILMKHLQDLDEVTDECKKYYAVAGFDISVCINMAIERQRAFMLVNSLISCHLLLNGVRLIPNSRTGVLDTVCYLGIYPDNICMAFGFLGCYHKPSVLTQCILADKIITKNPSLAIGYGKMHPKDKHVFDELGCRYRCFPDFRSMSFNRVNTEARYA